MKQSHITKRKSLPRASTIVLGAVLALIFAGMTSALVEAPMPMKEVLEQSKVIAEGVIDSIDLKTKMIVVKVGNCLKGQTPIKTIKMRIDGGQEWYPQAMMKQATVGAPVIIFYKCDDGNNVQSECYTNNFFFQFNGDQKPESNWQFTHIEIKMSRTFNGTTPALLSAVKDALAGKAPPPPIDLKVPPLTRGELMGLGAPPEMVSDDPDGYEAYRDWKLEEWSNPTEAAAVEFVDPGAPPDPGPQPGLLAEYFFTGEQISDFDPGNRGATVRRVDKQILLPASSDPVPGTELRNNFIARWTGLVRIAKAGKYKFFTATDDGSRMSIDGKAVVNNLGDHATTEVGGEIELKEGDYDFKMEFYQNGGPYECRALWEGPGIAKAPIPPEVLFHKGAISSRGKILRVKLTDGPKGKLAVGRAIEADFGKAPRLLYEAENLSDAPVKIAWGFQLKDGKYYESLPVSVTPGKWQYGLSVDMTQSNFKTEATKWQHSAEWADRSQMAKLVLVVYESPKSGTLSIDRVRLDKGAAFVRSIPLAIPAGRGVSFVDVDGDGNLDAVLCSESGNRVYLNKNNSFVDATTQLGLTGGSRFAACADVAGKLSLLMGTNLWSYQNGKLEQNNKLIPLNGALEGAGWLDANGDGKVDLLTSSAGGGLQLFLGEGNAFKDATAAFGLGNNLGAGKRNNFALADVDGDGFVDVLVNHGKGLLLHAEDGKTFKADTKSKIAYEAPGSTMGLAFGDYDNDGAFDLFVPQAGKSLLFHNGNDGKFTNVTDAAGAIANIPGNARSAAWADVNMDGNLDLIVGFTDGPPLIFMGDGKGKFTSSGFALNSFDNAYSAAGIAFGDFDSDGDPDMLLLGEKGACILVNETPRTGKVSLRIRTPRGKAPGMLVRLYDSADKPMGIRQPGMISNIGSQEQLEAFYAVTPGDAAAPVKYKVAVLFTDGESREQTVAVGKEGLIVNIEEAKKK